MNWKTKTKKNKDDFDLKETEQLRAPTIDSPNFSSSKVRWEKPSCPAKFSQDNTNLVGGWTTHSFEKYAQVKMGENLPQSSGWKKKCLKPPQDSIAGVEWSESSEAMQAEAEALELQSIHDFWRVKNRCCFFGLVGIFRSVLSFPKIYYSSGKLAQLVPLRNPPQLKSGKSSEQKPPWLWGSKC